MNKSNYVFPKVDLPVPKRSNFNLSKSLATTFCPGTLIPLWSKPMLPGDKFTIDMSAAIESMPMLGPLYGRWKVHTAFYFCQDSNLYGFMRNDERRSVEEIINQPLMSYTLPFNRYMTEHGVEGAGPGLISNSFATNAEDMKVAAGSIWQHFGWPAGYMGYVIRNSEYANTTVSNLFGSQQASMDYPQAVLDMEIPTLYEYRHQYLNAHLPFHYLNIVRHYYVNKQSKEVPFIKDSGDKSYSGVVEMVDLDVLDNVFRRLQSRPFDSYYVPSLDENGLGIYSNLNLSSWMDPSDDVVSSTPLDGQTYAFMESWESTFNKSNGGLFCVPFNMDLNRGLLNAEIGSYRAQLDVSQGVVSVETIWEQNKFQHLINILDVTGGRWSDALNGLWNVSIKTDISKPLYLGSLTTYIGQKDIVSNVSVSESAPQGTQTGYTQGGFKFSKKNKIRIKTDKPGVVICVMTMIPDVLYSQGFSRDYLPINMRGVFNPQMARLGYQDVPAFVLNAQTLVQKYLSSPSTELLEEATALPIRSVAPYNPVLSVGQQVAWAEYMSDVSECRGHFSYDQTLEFWVLNRVYNNTRIRRYDAMEGDEIIGSPLYVEQPEYDYSTYVFPWEYQNLFATNDPTAQNFRIWCNFDVLANRPIPKRTLPGM